MNRNSFVTLPKDSVLPQLVSLENTVLASTSIDTNIRHWVLGTIAVGKYSFAFSYNGVAEYPQFASSAKSHNYRPTQKDEKYMTSDAYGYAVGMTNGFISGGVAGLIGGAIFGSAAGPAGTVIGAIGGAAAGATNGSLVGGFTGAVGKSVTHIVKGTPFNPTLWDFLWPW